MTLSLTYTYVSLLFKCVARIVPSAATPVPSPPRRLCPNDSPTLFEMLRLHRSVLRVEKAEDDQTDWLGIIEQQAHSM